MVSITMRYILAVLVLGFSGASAKEPEAYEVLVKESVKPGFIVCNIPQVLRRSQLPAPSSFNITAGNKDDRFFLRPDTGDLCVKSYLNYDIHSRYKLTLTTEDNQVALIVVVTVEDDPDYPPTFNPTCYMPPRTKDIVDEWPFTASVTSYFLPKPLFVVGDGSKKKVSVVIDNGQCDVKAYIVITDKKVDLIDDDYKPSFTLSCSNGQEPPRTIPNVRVYWNASYHRPNDKGIDPAWFVDSPNDPHKRHVLVTLDVKNLYGANLSFFFCSVSVDLGFFGATVSGNVTLDPIGCPEGFYGGHCNETCVCQNGGSCHPFNGACKCPDEWTGRACDIKSALHPHLLHGKRAVFVYTGAAVGAIVFLALVAILVVYVIRTRARTNKYVSDPLVDSEPFSDTPSVPDVLLNKAV